MAALRVAWPRHKAEPRGEGREKGQGRRWMYETEQSTAKATTETDEPTVNRLVGLFGEAARQHAPTAIAIWRMHSARGGELLPLKVEVDGVSHVATVEVKGRAEVDTVLARQQFGAIPEFESRCTSVAYLYDPDDEPRVVYKLSPQTVAPRTYERRDWRGRASGGLMTALLGAGGPASASGKRSCGVSLTYSRARHSSGTTPRQRLLRRKVERLTELYMQQETPDLPPFDVCTEPVPEDATCEKLVLTNVECITYAQIKHISADPVLSAARVAVGPPPALGTQAGGELTVWVRVPCAANGCGGEEDQEARAGGSGGLVSRVKGWFKGK